MIKLSYNLVRLIKRAEGEAAAAGSPEVAKQPKPAPQPIVPALPATRPANYKRTPSPMAGLHGHGRALGVLDHLMQQKKTADDNNAVYPLSGFMPKDPDFLGPHTKDIPLGAMAGTILGIPGGILYHALMNDKSSVSDYMLAALKGGLIGGGAGAVSSGVFGYPNVPPSAAQINAIGTVKDQINNLGSNKQ